MLCWNRAYNPSMDNDFYIKKPMLLNAELTTQSREKKNRYHNNPYSFTKKKKKKKENHPFIYPFKPWDVKETLKKN